MKEAIGLVETRGLVGAIHAADAMLKAANVSFGGFEKTEAALITIKVVGEVGAVKSSVEAGRLALQEVGHLVSVHVIPGPHEELGLVCDIESPKVVEFEKIVKMPLAKLRVWASSLPGFVLSETEILQISKKQLVASLAIYYKASSSDHK